MPNSVGQISIDKYPRVVYAVAVDLKKALEYSTPRIITGSKAVRTNCLDKNDLRRWNWIWPENHRSIDLGGKRRRSDCLLRQLQYRKRHSLQNEQGSDGSGQLSTDTNESEPVSDFYYEGAGAN